MPRLQIFIAVGNRSYKNRLSLYGIAARQEVWRVSRNGSWLLGEEVSMEFRNKKLVLIRHSD